MDKWAAINVAIGCTGPIFWRAFRTPRNERSMVGIAAVLETFHATRGIAAQRLARHERIAGVDVTLVDIQTGLVLCRYSDIAIPRPDWPALPCPNSQGLQDQALKARYAV